MHGFCFFQHELVPLVKHGQTFGPTRLALWRKHPLVSHPGHFICQDPLKVGCVDFLKADDVAVKPPQLKNKPGLAGCHGVCEPMALLTAISWPPGTDDIYKIIKIVRALWLAEMSVCMRVCKHGCGVNMFCFSRANHASTNLKKFSSSKLHKFTIFTHSFVGWNLENRFKEGESIFLRLSWHFKSVFWKASFCKTRIDYACKTSWTRVNDW